MQARLKRRMSLRLSKLRTLQVPKELACCIAAVTSCDKVPQLYCKDVGTPPHLPALLPLNPVKSH
jgi:hypothetical protein